MGCNRNFYSAKTDSINRNNIPNTIVSATTATFTTTTTTTVSSGSMNVTTTFLRNYNPAISARIAPSPTAKSLFSSEVEEKRTQVTRKRKIVSDIIRCVLFLISIGMLILC